VNGVTITNNNNGAGIVLWAQYYMTLTATTNLGLANLFTYGTSPFNFNGTGGTLLLNGTYNCAQTVTFSYPATFGYNGNPGSGVVTFATGCNWFGSPITLYVTSFAASATASVYNQLNFNCYNASTISVGGPNLYLYGNIFFTTTKTINFAGTNFGGNTITSNLAAYATNINPISLVTFTNGNNIGTAEPNITFQGQLSQPVLVLSPTIFQSISIGNKGSITTSGSGRADFADGLALTTNIAIPASYNFFVTNPANVFALTVGGSGAPAVFSFAPAQYNPYNFPGNPSYTFSADSVSTIKFSTAGYTFNNINVAGSGTLRISAAITVSGTINVTPTTTFWVDQATVTANNITIYPAASSTTQPGYLKVSIPSQISSAYITATYASYGGGAVVYLANNYNPSGSVTIPFVSVSGVASGNILSPIGGSPGFTYSDFRSGNNLMVTITQTATVIPFPTQSNGPAPPVNHASSSQIISFVILFISLCFAFFTF